MIRFNIDDEIKQPTETQYSSRDLLNDLRERIGYSLVTRTEAELETLSIAMDSNQEPEKLIKLLDSLIDEETIELFRTGVERIQIPRLRAKSYS